MVTKQVMVPDLHDFARRHPALVAYLHRMLGRRADAEDVAQETYLKVVRAWPTVYCPDKILYTIAARTAIDRIRGDKRYSTRLQTVEEPPPTPGILDQALAHDAIAELEKGLEEAVAELAPNLRAMIQLRFHRKLSRADAARELGVSIKTVERWTTEAFAQIRTRVSELLARALP